MRNNAHHARVYIMPASCGCLRFRWCIYAGDFEEAERAYQEACVLVELHKLSGAERSHATASALVYQHVYGDHYAACVFADIVLDTYDRESPTCTIFVAELRAICDTYWNALLHIEAYVASSPDSGSAQAREPRNAGGMSFNNKVFDSAAFSSTSDAMQALMETLEVDGNGMSEAAILRHTAELRVKFSRAVRVMEKLAKICPSCEPIDRLYRGRLHVRIWLHLTIRRFPPSLLRSLFPPSHRRRYRRRRPPDNVR